MQNPADNNIIDTNNGHPYGAFSCWSARFAQPYTGDMFNYTGGVDVHDSSGPANRAFPARRRPDVRRRRRQVDRPRQGARHPLPRAHDVPAAGVCCIVCV
jgi:hypothetical protein